MIKNKQKKQRLTVPEKCWVMILNQVKVMPGIWSKKFYLNKNVSSKYTPRKMLLGIIRYYYL